MIELPGIVSALLSSALGGTAVAVTRYAVAGVDPLTLGALGFGIGFMCLVTVTLLMRERWPARADWAGVVALGFLFFGVLSVLFNLALVHTTSARAALALSTLPLLTMAMAATFGVAPLTGRKALGVLCALGGVATAFAAGLRSTPENALFGDLVMIAAALCMANYSVWSRPFIARSSPLAFTTVGVGAGATALTMIVVVGGLHVSIDLAAPGPLAAILYLGVVCGAAIFFLWSYALSRTTPTKVALSVTVNPVVASIAGALLLGEPIQANVLAGLVMVVMGIGIATSRR